MIPVENKNAKQLWYRIVQKAYAKMYGGYDKLLGGTVSNCLKDLTGAPVEKIDLRKY